MGDGGTALAGGGLVKQVGICLAIALALSGVVMGFIWGGPLGVAGAALGGMTIGAVTSWSTYRRDRRVRALVVAALDADSAPEGIASLVQLLGTPDVIRAHSGYLSREAAVLAGRYANGDASDY
jgi:hypothetical protein